MTHENKKALLRGVSRAKESLVLTFQESKQQPLQRKDEDGIVYLPVGVSHSTLSAV
jgi:hypothetical protein